MTLDELLALLPDNNTGAIDAADLRTIVTELFVAAHSSIQRVDYNYGVAPPTAGRINADVWSTAATTLSASEEDALGGIVTFAAIDRTGFPQPFVLQNADGSKMMRGEITGPTVDAGGYRTIPVTVTEVVGVAPTTNGSGEAVTIFVEAVTQRINLLPAGGP